PHKRAQLTYSYARIVKDVRPAVVNIYVQGRVNKRLSPLFQDPSFQRFFGVAPSGGLGSGVIVTSDGLVITNNHVIKMQGPSDIKIALADHREYPAKVILTDEKTDLAVLRIISDEKEFPYLQLADSDDAEVGDIVLAIGNPFGVGQTVTSGIISATARTRAGVSDYQFFLQTDAAVNKGNSGGALVSMDGKLLGINTFIISPSGGSTGISFAIPSNMVSLIIDSAIRGKKIKRPWFGADLQNINNRIAQAVGLDRPIGALVAYVTPDSPADQAGLKTSDVIVAVDGHETNDPQSVYYRLATKRVGNTAQLEVMRNGSKRNFTIELIEAPETVPREVMLLRGRHPLQGATVANLSPAVAEELSIRVTTGVVVVETRAHSLARRADMRPGDVILRLNRKTITNVRQLAKMLERSYHTWDLTIFRRGRKIRTTIRF
ncbi:MAG: Do family serine endopeptidase, partial [Alphaproteobacteria bacterium]